MEDACDNPIRATGGGSNRIVQRGSHLALERAVGDLPELDTAYYYKSLTPESGRKHWCGEAVVFYKQRPYPLTIPVDWAADPYHYRNWQWMLNNFQWLDRQVSAYKFGGGEPALREAAAYLLDWIRFSMDEDHDFPFRWKDDTVPFRAMRLAVVTNRALSSSAWPPEERLKLAVAAQRHFDELRDPTKFRDFNHGLFQMRGLMTLAQLLPCLEGAEGALAYATERVNHLWRQQYGNDGFHLENSPGYHYSALSEFIYIASSPEFVHQALIFGQDDIATVKGNFRFLVHPNGTVAMMGDTGLAKASVPRVQGDRIFKESGYVILAGCADSPENSYLIMRTGFRSRIHRHSDDMSFEWSEGGEVILTDAGTYSYDYADPIRQYVTSTRAHNTVVVDGQQYPWWAKAACSDFYDSCVVEHAVEGNVSRVKAARRFDGLQLLFERTLVLDKGRQLTVNDSLHSDCRREFVQWFHFSPEFEVWFNEIDGCYDAASQRNRVKVVPPRGTTHILVRGQKEPEYQGWTSRTAREITPSFALGFRVSQANAAAFEARFSVQRQFKVTFPGVGDLALRLPLDWSTNPGKTPLCEHHLLSLRWVRSFISSKDPNRIALGAEILDDFLRYHAAEQRPRSPFYLGPHADHTMAERVCLFADAYRAYGRWRSTAPLRKRLRHEIRMHLRVMATGHAYREKANHGLMVDRAILYSVHYVGGLDPRHELRLLALGRATVQVKWLFNDEFVTREHSISYQEYNLNILRELLNLLIEVDAGIELQRHLRVVLHRGQEFLGFAATEAGTYFPIGDTFREPSRRILSSLREALGSLDGHLERKLFGVEMHCQSQPELVVYPEAGFAIMRAMPSAGRLIELMFTASWHSMVHKQNDDLSFAVVDGGKDVVVDAGFSDRLNRSPEGVASRSEWAHACVVRRAAPWIGGTAAAAIMNDTAITGYFHASGLSAIRGTHSRVPNATVERTLILESSRRLIVVDEVRSTVAGEFLQLLPLGPGIDVTMVAPRSAEIGSAWTVHHFANANGTQRSWVATRGDDAGPAGFRWKTRDETEDCTVLVNESACDETRTLILAQVLYFNREASQVSSIRDVVCSGKRLRVAFDDTDVPLEIEIRPISPGCGVVRHGATTPPT